MELAERLCFYSFSGSIIFFLRDELGFSQAVASAQASVFNTLVYLTPLLGGFIADAYWGRYWTIAVFGGIYFSGMVLMAFAAYPTNLIKWLFMLAFFGLVALGAGGIKSNVVTMGGDQFNLDIPEESAQKDSYFIYFYWVINVGALVSYFVLAQIATEPQEFGLPVGYGYFYVFLFSSIALLVALLSFFSATNRYIIKPPSGSATAKYFNTINEAARTSTEGKLLIGGTCILLVGVACGVAQPFLTSQSVRDFLSYAAFGCAVLGITMVLVPTTGLPVWIKDDRNALYATRVISVVFNTISFQVVYAAMNYFALSACQMDVDIQVGNGKPFQINAAMLNSADCLAIIFVVPLLDTVIYPYVEKRLGRKPIASEKYMTGIVVSMMAIFSAAVLEIMRRRAPLVSACGKSGSAVASAPTPSPTSVDDDKFYVDHDQCYSQCAATGVEMSDFSVWWMAIPFFLVGTGECLCNIPIYDLCYSQTPPAYRSLAQAVFLFVTAVGSMLTGAFTTALSDFVTNDLNDGHLEYFYFACLGFVIAFIPINLYCFSHFHEVEEHIIEGMVHNDAASETSSVENPVRSSETEFITRGPSENPDRFIGPRSTGGGESLTRRSSSSKYSFGGPGSLDFS